MLSKYFVILSDTIAGYPASLSFPLSVRPSLSLPRITRVRNICSVIGQDNRIPEMLSYFEMLTPEAPPVGPGAWGVNRNYRFLGSSWNFPDFPMGRGGGG